MKLSVIAEWFNSGKLDLLDESLFLFSSKNCKGIVADKEFQVGGS